MLLLVIDNEQEQRKKELYSKELDVEGVLVSNSFGEAKEIIEELHPNVLLINHVIIENIALETSQLRELSEIYRGTIIAEVENAEIGATLVKQKLITDFFVTNKDEKKELEELKKVFENSLLKHDITKCISSAEKQLDKILELQKSF